MLKIGKIIYNYALRFRKFNLYNIMCVFSKPVKFKRLSRVYLHGYVSLLDQMVINNLMKQIKKTLFCACLTFAKGIVYDSEIPLKAKVVLNRTARGITDTYCYSAIFSAKKSQLYGAFILLIVTRYATSLHGRRASCIPTCCYIQQIELFQCHNNNTNNNTLVLIPRVLSFASSSEKKCLRIGSN